MTEEVQKAVAQVQPPRGETGPPGPEGPQGPAGRDGLPVDLTLVAEEVQKAVSQIRVDGIAGAVIDRSGNLVITMTNGVIRDLGCVVGKDGADGKAGADGKDGFGLEDFSAEFDGERTVTLKFDGRGVTKSHQVTLPIPLDRGVWRQGQYEKGDCVTYNGSLFIAQSTTDEQPEASKAWRLATKRGRDGKDGKDGVKGPQGPTGRAGRDLTQLGPDGSKW